LCEVKKNEKMTLLIYHVYDYLKFLYRKKAEDRMTAASFPAKLFAVSPKNEEASSARGRGFFRFS